MGRPAVQLRGAGERAHLQREHRRVRRRARAVSRRACAQMTLVDAAADLEVVNQITTVASATARRLSIDAHAGRPARDDSRRDSARLRAVQAVPRDRRSADLLRARVSRGARRPRHHGRRSGDVVGDRSARAARRRARAVDPASIAAAARDGGDADEGQPEPVRGVLFHALGRSRGRRDATGADAIAATCSALGRRCRRGRGGRRLRAVALRPDVGGGARRVAVAHVHVAGASRAVAGVAADRRRGRHARAPDEGHAGRRPRPRQDRHRSPTSARCRATRRPPTTSGFSS